MGNGIVHGHLFLQFKAALLNPFDVVAALADLAELHQIGQHQDVIQLSWSDGAMERNLEKSYGKLQLQIKSLPAGQTPKDHPQKHTHTLSCTAVMSAKRLA